jgi:hypothetical protein
LALFVVCQSAVREAKENRKKTMRLAECIPRINLYIEMVRNYRLAALVVFCKFSEFDRDDATGV